MKKYSVLLNIAKERVGEMVIVHFDYLHLIVRFEGGGYSEDPAARQMMKSEIQPGETYGFSFERVSSSISQNQGHVQSGKLRRLFITERDGITKCRIELND